MRRCVKVSLAVAALFMLMLPLRQDAQIQTTASHLSDGSTTGWSASSTPRDAYSLQVTDTLAAAFYVRLKNTASATPDCTDASDIVSRFIVPGSATGAGGSFQFPIGKHFNEGIGVCVTATVGDTQNDAVSSAAVAWNLDMR